MHRDSTRALLNQITTATQPPTTRCNTAKEPPMKRFYFLSVATLVAGIIGLLSLEATAAPKNTIKPIPAPKKGQPTAPPGSTNTTTATELTRSEEHTSELQSLR